MSQNLSLRSGAHTIGTTKIPFAAKLKKKERKQTSQGRDGRTARRHHTGILRREGVWCASRRPPLGVRLFLSHFAVSLRFSLQPSCHLAVSPFSSCSPLSHLPLSRRSPLPRSAPPPPPAGPLLSRLLAPFGAAPPSSLHILAPRVYPVHSCAAISAYIFSSRRRHTRSSTVSWARRCV